MKKINVGVICIAVCLMLTGCEAELQGYYDKWKEEVTPVTEEEAASELNIVDSYNDKLTNPIVTEDAEFIFVEPEVKETESSDASKYVKTVYLYLDESIYYPIEVPQDLEIITDNSKYIYAKDSSVSISVVSNVDVSDFSDFVFIENAESLTPNLIVSKEDAKGPQETAIHIVNDKAIIVRTYDNEEAYRTILKGLKKDSYKVSKFSGIETSVSTMMLDKLPLYTDYHVTVRANLGDDFQKIYNFNNGCLTISRELRRFEDAIETTGAKMAVVTMKNIADKYYKSVDTCYMELGDYVIGLYRVNYNTTYTCFGFGDEAKYNTVAFLESQNK